MSNISSDTCWISKCLMLQINSIGPMDYKIGENRSVFMVYRKTSAAQLWKPIGFGKTWSWYCSKTIYRLIFGGLKNQPVFSFSILDRAYLTIRSFDENTHINYQEISSKANSSLKSSPPPPPLSSKAIGNEFLFHENKKAQNISAFIFSNKTKRYAEFKSYLL
jgi:hypothetical protein